ncbi:MAG: hypothetical protein HY913_21750 [Desulfomonile tiedjei]|nr:hypothetical protein [Desulfomonile tiedjei]
MSSPDPSLLTLVATISGPSIAIILSFGFSIWYQYYRRKLEAQQRLFEVLMAYRAGGFQSSELVNSLNLIDVIFANKPRIIELWHNYYNLSSQQSRPGNEGLLHYAYLDLLSGIAKSLRYPLTQTDVARHYNPEAYAEPLVLEYQIRHELLRVLKDTARIAVDKQENEAPPS